MNELIADPLRYNAWATRTLIEYCRGLSEEQLGATTPGAAGTLLETLRHFVNSEGGYRALVVWDESRRGRRIEGGLDAIDERARENERLWEEYLTGEIDPDRVLRFVDSDGNDCAVPVGVIVTQALQHGIEHRGQICTIITTLGLEPPDLQPWAYGEDTGRATYTPPKASG